MLNRLIEWSLRNQLLVMVAVLLTVLGGIWSIRETRVDAIPDLSDVQVILYTEFPGQAPQVIEDQVTYPITSKMLAVPHAKVVRGYSFFGCSFVYVIFEDGTDLYWARSRVLEYLSGLTGKLPPGVTPQLGPDATGVGWAFMYVLNSPERSLAELRHSTVMVQTCHRRKVARIKVRCVTLRDQAVGICWVTYNDHLHITRSMVIQGFTLHRENRRVCF